MSRIRWNEYLSRNVENKEIDSFLADIVYICVKHRMAISHEDEHGNFIIKKLETLDDENIAWLLDANDGVLK